MQTQGNYSSYNNTTSSNPVASTSSSGASRPRQGSPLPQPPTPPGAPDVRGRHRKRAELQRLTQEIRMLQEELDAIVRIPPASQACKELVAFMDNCPDPFLPNSQGVDSARQRWFDPPVESKRCCWKS